MRRRGAQAALVLILSGLSLAASAVTLNVCDDVDDPPSLNPYQVFSEKTHTLIQQMLEGLVRFDPQGKIEPALAERWERVDDKTLRFHLRRGVVFHNGESLDAATVKFSLEKYIAPETHYPGVGFVETISSVTVVDADTVDVVTNRPDGLLLNRLAFIGHIVPRRYYQRVGDRGFSEHPVGTGPFRFESWEKGDRIVFSANRSYWMKGYPRAEGLVFRFLPADRQVDELLAGRLDLLLNLPGTRTLDVQQSRNAFVLKSPTFYTVVGNFNLNHAPLANKRIREALNLAIDRRALVRYDLLGNGTPIGTISLPGEFGHDETLEPYPYDPARARRILKEEGYPEGFSLNVLLKVNARRAGQIIAEELRKIGVVLKMTPMTDAQIFVLMKDRTPWDMLIADCPDPMLHAFFIRDVFLGGKSPFSLSSVPAVDERIDRLVGTLDVEAQRRVSMELDRYIRAEFLAVPTYQRIRTYGVRRGVVFAPYVSGEPFFFGTEPPHARVD